jgi:MoaA/NifB/PqqE/SkfB family radical SAM enzyme
MPYRDPTLNSALVEMTVKWLPRRLPDFWRYRRLFWGLLRSRGWRRRSKRTGLLVPFGIGLSPTTACNLKCTGCYARFHKTAILAARDVEKLITEAEVCGVFMFVITGGEPFKLPWLLDLYRRHPYSLFLIVTNGTLISAEIAKALGRLGNVAPMVSIEGTREQTEARRGRGVYDKILQTMAWLRRNKIVFGFSTTVTRANISYVGGAAYLEAMSQLGCAAGFFNDLVPGCREDWSSLPSPAQKEKFCEQLNKNRRHGRLAIVHLPDDEYDKNNRCVAVGSGSMHINSAGDVEPCPFAHWAAENIKTKSFEQILCSRFLRALRRHPTVLQAGAIGCSLVNNDAQVKIIARQTGAIRTSS